MIKKMEINCEKKEALGSSKASQSSTDKCIPFINNNKKSLHLSTAPYSAAQACVFLFLSAKNVPSALSNGRGEEKTKKKKDSDKAGG